MAYSSSTDSLRLYLAELFKNSLHGITGAAFGDGGHDPLSGLALPTDRTAIALGNQMILNPIPDIDIEIVNNGLWVQITGRLAESDLVGSTISEFGIIVNGALIGIRNSSPIVKESDEEIVRTLTFKF